MDDDQEVSTTELAQVRHEGPADLSLVGREMDVRITVQRIEEVRKFIATVLQKGTDYASIEALGRVRNEADEDKPQKKTLLLPGAEKVALYLGLRPESVTKIKMWNDGHMLVSVYTKLVDRRSGKVIGFGQGSCSTRESKYAYRYLPSREAPKDDFEAQRLKVLGLGRYRSIYVNKVKQWVWCERITNPNLADEYHTVRAIADKRAFVMAVRKVAALSEAFTDSLEDYIDAEIIEEMVVKPPQQPRRASEKQGQPTNGKTTAPAATAKPDDSKEGPAMGRLKAVIEDVVIKDQGGSKLAWVKFKGQKDPFSCWDTKLHANLQALKGREVNVEYADSQNQDKTRTFHNIHEVWPDTDAQNQSSLPLGGEQRQG